MSAFLCVYVCECVGVSESEGPCCFCITCLAESGRVEAFHGLNMSLHLKSQKTAPKVMRY